MPDTILYQITDVQDCNCYQQNTIEVGDCPTILECTCSLPLANNGLSVVSNPPPYITDFDVDQITPLSTVFDEGTVCLNFYVGPGSSFDQIGICNIKNNIDSDYIAFIARLPEETTIIDFNNLIYVYCGPFFSDLGFGGPCVISETISLSTSSFGNTVEVAITGLVATYSDNTINEPSMRYIVGILDTDKSCLGLVHIDSRLEVNINIDTSNPAYNKADCDGVNDLFISSTLYNEGLGYNPYNLPDGVVLEAGSKFIVEVDSFVFAPYLWNTVEDTFGNDSFRLGFRGYVLFTGLPPGPGPTFSINYLGSALGKERIEVTILEDWEVGDLFDLYIENGNPTACPGSIGNTVNIKYDFTSTGVPFRNNGNMNNYIINQTLTIT